MANISSKTEKDDIESKLESLSKTTISPLYEGVLAL
jgi:hypothetical protein